jgi:hypothetical protein
VADTIGTTQVGLTRLVGVGLIGFASLVLSACTLPADRMRVEALLISLADLTWVGATIAVLVTGELNATGTGLAIVVATAVLDFGLAQLRFRRRLD